MVRRNNQIILIIIVALGLVLLAGFLNPLSLLPDTEEFEQHFLTQYGQPVRQLIRGDRGCQEPLTSEFPIPRGGIPIATLVTPLSTFTFEPTFEPPEDRYVFRYMREGGIPTSTIFADGVRVRKDGIVIDEFLLRDVLPDGEDNPGDQTYYRAYSDSGQVFIPDEPFPRRTGSAKEIFLPDGVSGINAIYNIETKGGICPGLVNVLHQYKIVYPEDFISVEIDTPDTIQVEGTSAPIDIKVISSESLTGTLIVDFTIDTILGTLVKRETVEDLQFPVGESTHQFNISLDAPETELKINAFVVPKRSTSGFKGVAVINYERETNNPIFGSPPDHRPPVGIATGLEDDITTLSTYTVGKVGEVEKTIMIVPKPLFLDLAEGVCPLGYEISEDGTFCVRDDISDLSCVLTGCPTIDDVPYACSSSGLCEQTIFIQGQCTSDQECIELTGGIANKCDIPSGLCFNERIFTEFVQCEIASDCVTPCQGVTSQCVSSFCQYDGFCEELTIDCEDFGCPVEASCQFDEDLGASICVEQRFNIVLLIGLIGVIVLLLVLLGRRFRGRK